jgi:hypothetical protein
MRNLVGLVVVITIIAGCNIGPAPLKRGKLSGKVTLDGKPVATGQIRFIALDPDGVNVAATIANGQFDLPEGQGPAKGKYRVEFSVPSATKSRIPNPDIPGQWLEEAAETLPPRFHRDSNIIFDYDPERAQPYDAALQSQ